MPRQQASRSCCDHPECRTPATSLRLRFRLVAFQTETHESPTEHVLEPASASGHDRAQILPESRHCVTP
jgi:hypothetical protein